MKSSLLANVQAYRLAVCLAICLVIGLAGFTAPVPYQPAAASPNAVWPEISLPQFATGLESPVHLTHAGDGSGRLFVVEQRGRIRILKDGLVNTPFLDITGQVRSQYSPGGGSEEGLLSVAFPPDFASQGYFYVYYTNQQGNNQVSRFRLGSSPNQADPSSEKLVLMLIHPTFSNHNGGQIAFGPDGYLYIATGDGGGGGDPNGNAQNPGSLLGKVLRIDVETNTNPPPEAGYLLYFPLVFSSNQAAMNTSAYSIPPDNPFLDRPAYLGEIWALGLRNPWRFSFDRQTGDLWIADVGQGAWEEINYQPAASKGGENYGWNILEGLECYGGGNCDKSGFILPVSTYSTHSGGSCSVTGGFVYRGPAHPGLQGIYFFADYCSGKIWGLQPEGSGWVQQELDDTSFRISSFGEDQAGELYLVDHGGGVYRIEGSGGSNP